MYDLQSTGAVLHASPFELLYRVAQAEWFTAMGQLASALEAAESWATALADSVSCVLIWWEWDLSTRALNPIWQDSAPMTSSPPQNPTS